MRNGRPPSDEQLAALRESLGRNAILQEILTRARTLGLPQWYVTAGGVAQTVWNVVTGRPAQHGIKDYDLIYHDAADLSWAAEDTVIRAGREVFGDLPATVEIRNQARVHLWYEDKFGLPCAAHRSSEAAIGTFPATATCVGVRLEEDGEMRVHAPHGLSDVLGLIVRPNPVLAPRHVYEGKAGRWRRRWPELTVLPWPAQEPDGDTGASPPTSDIE